MRLTFLGTGASDSRTRLNVSAAIDGKVLLDAGAPLLSQLPAAGIDPDDVETLLISHCHGDHILGMATFLISRVMRGGPPLLVVGPSVVDRRIDEMCEAVWGSRWRAMGPGFELEFARVTGGDRLQASDLTVEAHEIIHDRGQLYATPSIGFCVSDGSVRLGYTGDSAEGPWVDNVVDGCTIGIVECTGASPGPTHLSHDFVRQLPERHPQTSFYATHFSAEAPYIEGVAMAHDLLQVEC